MSDSSEIYFKPLNESHCYFVKDHPWENQDLPEEIIQEAAGFDLFSRKGKKTQNSG